MDKGDKIKMNHKYTSRYAARKKKYKNENEKEREKKAQNKN